MRSWVTGGKLFCLNTCIKFGYGEILMSVLEEANVYWLLNDMCVL